MADMNFFEMQALERANLTRQDFEPKQNTVLPRKSARIHEKITKMPVEFPEGKQYPDFKDYFSTASQKESTLQESQNAEMKNEVTSKLQELLHDPEAALLGGLIMLLRSEGADEELLAALGYILL